jgi:hypothetical protein
MENIQGDHCSSKIGIANLENKEEALFFLLRKG